MKKFLNILALIIALGATSCTRDSKATIEGCISEAEDKMLYLDYIGVEKTIVADSLQLDAKGTFRFRVAKPECFDFYRLRIGREIAYLSVDSTETLTFTATLPTLSTAYEVAGSEDNLMLKALVMKLSRLQSEIQQLTRTTVDYARLDELVQEYKKDVRMEYIYPNPGKPYAYFALFQRLGGQYIFDPLTNRDDIRCFAAVATNLDLFYPEAERTQNIKSVAIKGLRNTRPAQTIDYSTLEGKIHEASIIDIALPDIDGRERRLTDLKGKVVLLDFNLYAHPQSSARVLLLRELYNRYADHGLEIYQISLDSDEHFWKTTVENIPWICVRPIDAPQSKEANLYGVRELPTYFLINRAGEVVKRDEKVEDLEKELERLLAE